MKIFSVAYNVHDHNTYDGEFHLQLERYSRVKHNIKNRTSGQGLGNTIWGQDYMPNSKGTIIEKYLEGSKRNRRFIHHYQYHYEIIQPAFNSKDHDVTAFTSSNNALHSLISDPFDNELINFKDIYDFDPKSLWDHILRDNIYYIDHHQSHAAYAYLSSGFEESDILAIDGAGMGGRRCFFIDNKGTITNLSKEIPIGWIWNHISCISGLGCGNAGKLMGLAAFGKYSEWYHTIIAIMINDVNVGKHQQLPKDKKIYKIDEHGLEDFAYTLQQYTLDLIKEHIYPLKTSNNLCIAGGVAYNGYMNEEFLNHYDNVHVPPAVGDEGQSLGTYMHANYVLNNDIHIPNVFAGKEHGYTGLEKVNITEVAQAIADGAIIGWYQGKSESGNRALGNRSILADPRNPDIKDIINSTIKLREDFRPFAPSVLEEHYKDYFDTNQPSPHMSRIVPVI